MIDTDPMTLTIGAFKAFDGGDTDMGPHRAALVAFADQAGAHSRESGPHGEAAGTFRAFAEALPPVLDLLEAGDRDGAAELFRDVMWRIFNGK